MNSILNTLFSAFIEHNILIFIFPFYLIIYSIDMIA